MTNEQTLLGMVAALLGDGHKQIGGDRLRLLHRIVWGTDDYAEFAAEFIDGNGADTLYIAQRLAELERESEAA